MSTPCNETLLVPVELSQFVYDNDMGKSFAIFLYLKLLAGDKVKACDPVFNLMKKDLRMADSKNRTFRKHFQVLLDQNWIGFNENTAIYHVRSFDFIRVSNGLRRRWATKVTYEDIKQIQTYLVGVLITNEINRQKYYWESVKRRPGAVAKHKGAANQSQTSFPPSKPPYYGLSNQSLARVLGCKYTRACNLKQAAERAGYLRTHQRYEDVAELKEADFLLRSMFADKDFALAKRLRFFKRRSRDGYTIIKVVRQLHNEIVPLMAYKRLQRFGAIRMLASKTIPSPLGVAPGIAA